MYNDVQESMKKPSYLVEGSAETQNMEAEMIRVEIKARQAGSSPLAYGVVEAQNMALKAPGDGMSRRLCNRGDG
jgi:hypothetical protein